ncbi:MAG TPA: 50S ribosomal protein L11 methyltransferase [Tepidiformaceae bacterium]|nr:50S ribosomal protein L11 methyltransferase [Tepidiformaceae bacterium]
MLWFEITASVPTDDVEAVSALMRDVAPGGVTVEEPIDILGPEMGFRVRGGEPVLVRVYLPSSELGAVLTEDLRRAMEEYPSVELTARPIYEEDWAVSWREFFGVVETGGRIVVVPSWVEHEVAPGQIALRLDPGQAFGTGHHETTRMCLKALDDLVTPGMTLLDVGTGSGILAIAAIKLGAGQVDAVDIDPVAVEVARANCVENGVLEGVTLASGKLDTDRFAGPYEMVIANISTDANIGLAESFASVTVAGSHLVLSGILDAHEGRVRDAMEAAGFESGESAYERDWCLLKFTRR